MGRKYHIEDLKHFAIRITRPQKLDNDNNDNDDKEDDKETLEEVQVQKTSQEIPPHKVQGGSTLISLSNEAAKLQEAELKTPQEVQPKTLKNGLTLVTLCKGAAKIREKMRE